MRGSREFIRGRATRWQRAYAVVRRGAGCAEQQIVCTPTFQSTQNDHTPRVIAPRSTGVGCGWRWCWERREAERRRRRKVQEASGRGFEPVMPEEGPNGGRRKRSKEVDEGGGGRVQDEQRARVEDEGDCGLCPAKVGQARRSAQPLCCVIYLSSQYHLICVRRGLHHEPRAHANTNTPPEMRAARQPRRNR